MAIQSQNTTLFVSSDGTNYSEVGNIQTIGDIDFGSREVIKIENINNEDLDKLLGTLSLGALELTYVYDPDEPNGNGIIKSAYDASLTTRVFVRIELPNKLTDDGNGTRFEFQAVVPSYKLSGIEKNGYVKTVVSLEQVTKPTVTAAA